MANTDPLAGVVEPIRSLMLERGPDSINGLAEASGIAYSTLRGKLLFRPESITMSELLRLATAIGVEPQRLVPTALAAAVAS